MENASILLDWRCVMVCSTAWCRIRITVIWRVRSLSRVWEEGNEKVIWTRIFFCVCNWVDLKVKCTVLVYDIIISLETSCFQKGKSEKFSWYNYQENFPGISKFSLVLLPDKLKWDIFTLILKPVKMKSP